MWATHCRIVSYRPNKNGQSASTFGFWRKLVLSKFESRFDSVSISNSLSEVSMADCENAKNPRIIFAPCVVTKAKPCYEKNNLFESVCIHAYACSETQCRLSSSMNTGVTAISHGDIHHSSWQSPRWQRESEMEVFIQSDWRDWASFATHFLSQV